MLLETRSGILNTHNFWCLQCKKIKDNIINFYIILLEKINKKKKQNLICAYTRLSILT